MSQEQVDLDSSVGYVLKQAAAALRGAMDTALRPLGLSVPQYACLELLGQRPGLSAAELARGAFVTRQSMHTVLQGLEDRGLLERPSAAPHGRALPTRLTDEGTCLLARASHLVAEVEGRMIAALPAGNAARLHRDLTTCAEALDPTKH
ncbi:MarR family winged helix-turn-helix transcriptional regulator [Nocardia aobensis]|uniref:MarR family winged helix-turn-helix transcriptional regulator n=1 Tax=Nocardia aobensis TaxID=257277 RepID=UPI00056B43E3|nr:MarR family transcriptional regulator [Nocardia aobensis]